MMSWTRWQFGRQTKCQDIYVSKHLCLVNIELKRNRMDIWWWMGRGRRRRGGIRFNMGVLQSIFFTDFETNAQAVSKLWYYNSSLVSIIIIIIIRVIIIIIPYIMIALVSASQSPKINFECEVPVHSIYLLNWQIYWSAQGSYPTCDISPNPSAICHGILYRPSLDYQILPLLLRRVACAGFWFGCSHTLQLSICLSPCKQDLIEILQIILHPECPSNWCK